MSQDSFSSNELDENGGNHAPGSENNIYKGLRLEKNMAGTMDCKDKRGAWIKMSLGVRNGWGHSSSEALTWTSAGDSLHSWGLKTPSDVDMMENKLGREQVEAD